MESGGLRTCVTMWDLPEHIRVPHTVNMSAVSVTPPSLNLNQARGITVLFDIR